MAVTFEGEIVVNQDRDDALHAEQTLSTVNSKGEKTWNAQLTFPGSIFLHGLEFLPLIPKLVYCSTIAH